MLPHIGFWELILILAVALLLFGRKIPDIGRALGRTFVEFKKGVSQSEKDQQ